MGMQLHVATKYDVEFQGMFVDCRDYAEFIWDLHERAAESDFGELVEWNNEDENMFELSKDVISKLIEGGSPHREILDKWLSLSPEYNEFVRIEIY